MGVPTRNHKHVWLRYTPPIPVIMAQRIWIYMYMLLWRTIVMALLLLFSLTYLLYNVVPRLRPTNDHYFNVGNPQLPFSAT